MSFVRSWFHRYVQFVGQKPLGAFALAVILIAWALPLAASLQLRSSLKELLPKNSPSVRALDRVVEKVGGAGQVVVVVESPDFEQNKRFLHDLEKALLAWPKGTVRYINYRLDTIKKFYEDHALYYMSDEELDKLTRYLKKVSLNPAKINPLYVDLEEDESEDSELDIEAIEKQKMAELSPLRIVGDYYGIDEGRRLIMLVRPFGSNVSVEYSRELITKLKSQFAELKPETYHPEMVIGLSGGFVTATEEYDTLRHDIVSTAALCILLVALAIVFYFRRLVPLFFLGTSLAIGLLWTFAVARLVVGHLNSQTAFLGSIIIGTGINYGIILLGRYYVERRDKEAIPAMQAALAITLTPTFVAAATTGVSFGVLVVAGVGSLAQFGFIGLSGMFLCWLASVLWIPLVVTFFERLWPTSFAASPSRFDLIGDGLAALGRWLPKRAAVVVAVFIAALLASIFLVVRFYPDAMEYNLARLRNRVSQKSGTEIWDSRAGKVFKDSSVATVIHVDSLPEALEVQRIINDRVQLQPENKRTVSSTTTVMDLLPKNQEARLTKIMAVRALLSGEWLSRLPASKRAVLESIREHTQNRPVIVSDLPEELTRSFCDLEGGVGTVMYVNPRRDRSLSDGRNIISFADTLGEIKLQNGKVIYAAGDPSVFADLLRIIQAKAPLLTLASFIAVILIIIFAMRQWKNSLVLVGALFVGIGLMMGAAAQLHLRVNFFNFIIVPLTIGIAVDYSINVAVPIIREPAVPLSHLLRSAGGAVFLCSLTTIIGYYVLTLANNQGLASFGVVAIVGEITCLLAALVLTPALLVLTRRE